MPHRDLAATHPPVASRLATAQVASSTATAATGVICSTPRRPQRRSEC